MLPEHQLTDAMHLACAEARQWVGATTPNPPVGAAALDSKGAVIAVAAHHRAGKKHAEAKLIELCANIGRLADIHTLCVTLEPCHHHGRQPPCAEMLIRYGIKRVVVGTRDRNPNVKGGGIDYLRQHGVEIIEGIHQAECQQLIHAFAYATETGKPWIAIKRAFDRNGSMIPPVGKTTFTSPDSLRLAHRLRKKADAIITGSGTILADNPQFTVRHVADYPDKRRWLAVLDRRRRVPQSYIDIARERGLDVIIYGDTAEALADLHNKGVQDILVEAGPTISDVMLKAGLWTMLLDIHRGDNDRLDIALNESKKPLFDVKEFVLENILPN